MSEYREALQRLVNEFVDTHHFPVLDECRALLARGESLNTDLLYAAATADWGQVAMNGGPPCFHLDGARFCLRAERWAGHDAHGQMHRFISLAELVGESVEPAAAEKARERYQEGDVLLFIGWLSGDIAELRKVEVPRLADSWRRFKEALTSPPASKVEAEKAREPMHEGFPVDTKVRDILTDKVGTIVSYHCRFEVEWDDGTSTMDVHCRQLDHCGSLPSPPAATEGNIK